MNDPQQIKLFLTKEHDCSYLPDQRASTLFVDPYVLVDEDTYDQLNQLGFRRSGRHYYKPHCADCKACIPSRIPVQHFKPSRQQQRTIKKNAALSKLMCTSINSFDEHYALYSRYIEARHKDGDMYPPNRDQFEQFIQEITDATRFIEFRDAGKLVCVSVVDLLSDGLSAVYTYFDPEMDEKSLGVYAILHNIELAANQNLPFLYLGYWIEDCDKMSYKTNFRPTQLLIDQEWKQTT